MSKAKFFYYGQQPGAGGGWLGAATLISEVILPNSRSKLNQLSDKDFPAVMKLGSEVDLVFNNLRVLLSCKRLSVVKNPLPQGNTIIHPWFYRGFSTLVFKYKGKKIWVLRNEIRLLNRAV